MGKPISDEERQRLREAAPDVLRELYGITNLKRPFRCPNPNHKDKTPSASFDMNSNRVVCFGCDGHWDAFDLVGLHDGIDNFVEQAYRVAALVGIVICGEVDAIEHRSKCKSSIPLPQDFNSDLTAPKPLNLYDVCHTACCELGREGGSRALHYLRERGFDDREIAANGFGFTSNPKDISPQFKVCEPDAIGFITIPYFNKDRKTIRYVALRPLPGNKPCKQKEWRLKGVPMPIWQEYLLSMHLPIICVTEGVFDAVALKKISGLPCVALGSTVMTGRLLDLLAKQAPGTWPATVILLLDNDDAGRNATSKLEAGLDSLRIKHSSPLDVLGENKDPNDLLISLKGKSWGFKEGIYKFGLKYYNYVKTEWF